MSIHVEFRGDTVAEIVSQLETALDQFKGAGETGSTKSSSRGKAKAKSDAPKAADKTTAEPEATQDEHPANLFKEATALLHELHSHDAHAGKIGDVLKHFNCKNFTEVKEEDYQALYTMAQDLHIECLGAAA